MYLQTRRASLFARTFHRWLQHTLVVHRVISYHTSLALVHHQWGTWLMQEQDAPGVQQRLHVWWKHWWTWQWHILQTLAQRSSTDTANAKQLPITWHMVLGVSDWSPAWVVILHTFHIRTKKFLLTSDNDQGTVFLPSLGTDGPCSARWKWLQLPRILALRELTKTVSCFEGNSGMVVSRTIVQEITADYASYISNQERDGSYSSWKTWRRLVPT